MEFGFTNDDAKYEAAVSYREAAIADGWKCEPTYGDSEPMESAARLYKDGFVMGILSRDKRADLPPHKWKYEAQVTIWGPDGNQVTVPYTYDWSAIAQSIRNCMYCHAKDVDTERVGFAGRSCRACLPAQKARAEFPGWTR